MDIGALKGRKGYGYNGKGKGGMYKGKRKGKSKGFKGKKGKGMKGKGKGQGCFICGDPNHWSKECPKGKGRMSALTEEEGQQEGNERNGAKMLNGMVMNGMNMTGVRIGLVLLMIGLVTGLGPKMTGVVLGFSGLVEC